MNWNASSKNRRSATTAPDQLRKLTWICWALVSLAAVLLGLAGSLAAQERPQSPLPEPHFDATCSTNWSDRWLCPGDRVPHAGHLLEGWQVSACANDRRTALRVPQLQQQRDGCLARELVWRRQAQDQQEIIENLEAGTSALQDELSQRPTWWTVFGGVGGGTVGGVLLTLLLLVAL